MGSPTSINFGGLDGPTDDFSGTFDHHCPSSYPKVDYIVRYRAHLDGRRFPAIRLGLEAKIFRDVCTERTPDLAVCPWMKW